MQEISRRKPVVRNRAACKIEVAALELATAYPALGPARAANKLAKLGLHVLPSSVRSVLAWHHTAPAAGLDSQGAGGGAGEGTGLAAPDT